MKDTDKVTLTVGQLKRLVKESLEDNSNGDWCVIIIGGPLGNKPKYRFRGHLCIIYDEGLTEEEAKNKARDYRRELLTTDDKKYGVEYKAANKNELVKVSQ